MAAPQPLLSGAIQGEQRTESHSASPVPGRGSASVGKAAGRVEGQGPALANTHTLKPFPRFL